MNKKWGNFTMAVLVVSTLLFCGCGSKSDDTTRLPAGSGAAVGSAR